MTRKAKAKAVKALAQEKRIENGKNVLDQVFQPSNVEKDEEERQLEKLIFGDDEGFQEGLKEQAYDDSDFEDSLLDQNSEEDLQTENGIENAADDDVCRFSNPPKTL
jgi:hypothetical protein